MESQPEAGFNWLFCLPKDVIIHILVNYVDSASAVRVAALDACSWEFFHRHGIYEKLFRRDFGAPRICGGGKNRKKREQKCREREKSPAYWGAWLRGRLSRQQDFKGVDVRLGPALSYLPSTYEFLSSMPISSISNSFFHNLFLSTYKHMSRRRYHICEGGHRVSIFVLHQGSESKLAPREDLLDSSHGGAIVGCALCGSVACFSLGRLLEAWRELVHAEESFLDMKSVGKSIALKLAASQGMNLITLGTREQEIVAAEFGESPRRRILASHQDNNLMRFDDFGLEFPVPRAELREWAEQLTSERDAEKQIVEADSHVLTCRECGSKKLRKHFSKTQQSMFDSAKHLPAACKSCLKPGHFKIESPTARNSRISKEQSLKEVEKRGEMEEEEEEE